MNTAYVIYRQLSWAIKNAVTYIHEPESLGKHKINSRRVRQKKKKKETMEMWVRILLWHQKQNKNPKLIHV